MRPKALPAATAVAVSLLAAVAASAADRVDPQLLAGLKARSIGPAAVSGRIGAIAGAPSAPETLYVGAANGGVWKSTDGGLVWSPLFDDQPVASIGAIAVSATDSDVVWVGTGEAEVRNSISAGDGVYRSLDGGRTWAHLGLDKTAHIGRIVLDPTDPDVAYVAALGQVWGENPERGVFKTEDGGKSWKKVLYVDPRTGAADIAMDPQNPRKLFAAMWDYRRWPWSFRSGGPGSGLYVTYDGGASWKRLTPDDGLPEGTLGRIGLAVAPSDPDVVYALVEGEKEQALYRSDDGGASWKKTDAGDRVGNRPFYYSRIAVDPADPNRLYSLYSQVSVSSDGGRSFEVLVPFRSVHPDHHAMWIDPTDPRHLVEGNDGGVYVSRDHGRTWRFVADLPLGQPYHVRVDDAEPYHVYGGLQDNGSWVGPSAVWENGGIRNLHWQEVDFGDGFDTLPVPGDPQRGFAMSQEGYLVRWDLRTGERKDVRPAPTPPASGEPEELRFNWNAAIAQDPFDPHTLYFGSQFVHRSTDLGETWTVISPDLTSDNPEWQKQAESGGLTPDVTGAENFTTLIALAPSPVERGTIWAGSDDGRLHVTRDGGRTWTEVERNVPGVPAGTWIPHIWASTYDGGTAFVVFDDHRRANPATYVFETTDYGASWKSLATADLRGYALAILQDPVDPKLLFLGTESGLWVSLDGGGSWFKWTHGVPTVPVMDLAFQARENDLVLATHGRSFFVLDDVRPLREMSPELLAEPVHLFPVADALEVRVAQSPSTRFAGDGEFRGDNEPYGAVLTFSLSADDLPLPDEKAERERKQKERAAKAAAKAKDTEAEKAAADGGAGGKGEKPKATIEITDAAGKRVRALEEPVHRGVNRVVWDLTRDAFKRPPLGDVPSFFRPRGPAVLPGTYGVTVRYAGQEARGEVRVLPDPRRRPDPEGFQAQHDLAMRLGAFQDALVTAIERVRATAADVKTVVSKAKAADEQAKEAARARGEEPPEKGAHGELIAAGGKLGKSLTDLERELWTPRDVRGIPKDETPWAALTSLARSLGSSFDAPTAAQREYAREAEAKVRKAVSDVERAFAEQVAPFREQARQAGLELLAEEGKIELP